MTSLYTCGTTAADLSQEMGVCFLSSTELAMVVEYKIPSVGVIKEVLVVVRVARTVVVERVVTVVGGVAVTVAGGVTVRMGILYRSIEVISVITSLNASKIIKAHVSNSVSIVLWWH